MRKTLASLFMTLAVSCASRDGAAFHPSTDAPFLTAEYANGFGDGWTMTFGADGSVVCLPAAIDRCKPNARLSSAELQRLYRVIAEAEAFDIGPIETTDAPSEADSYRLTIRDRARTHVISAYFPAGARGESALRRDRAFRIWAEVVRHSPPFLHLRTGRALWYPGPAGNDGTR